MPQWVLRKHQILSKSVMVTLFCVDLTWKDPLARLQLDKVYGLFGRRLAHPPHYNTSGLAPDPHAREQLNDALQDKLEKQTHSVTCQQILRNFTIAAGRNAAKTTIGTVQAGLKPHLNPDIAILSQTQKHLRIRIENKSDKAHQQCLKAERNRVLREIRNRALQTAESQLDERAKEVEHLKNSAKNV